MSGSNEKLRVLRRIPEIRFDEELRGYNKHQVDRVLENLAPLADEVDVLVNRLSEAERRAAAAEARVMEGGGPAPAPAPVPTAEPARPTSPVASENFDETLSKTLLLAQRTADATVEEANESAARIKAEAEAEAAATRQAVEAEAAAMRASAADERTAAMDQANREVAALIDAARTAIEAKVAGAEAELVENEAATRDDLIEQIGALQRSRDALALDVEHFEGHLTSRREVIRQALGELTAVVDDPERLRTVMPPTPMADMPDVAEASAPQIKVSALDTLVSDVDAEVPVDHVATDAPTDDDLGTWADDGSGDEVDTWAGEGAETPDPGPTADVAADAVSAESAGDDVAVAFGDEANVDQALASGVVIDALPENDLAPLGEPTQAMPVVADTAAERSATSDPFLDELRRATSEEDDDEALSKFLNDADDDSDKGGWFGRRK